MKILRHLAFLGLLCFGIAAASAADQPAAASGVTPEFKALVAKIQAKLEQGQNTEAALAAELKEFDALIARYQDQKTEEVAAVILAEASLYVQVFRQMEKATGRLRQLKADFAETEPGKVATRALQDLERREAAKNLAGQAAPEIHFTWASRGNAKTLSELKGKVVILDFWATWCGPCVASFPAMRELASRYKDFPVEIVGVTSIQGRVMGLEPAVIDCQDDPKKELGLMADYVKAKDITWTVAVSTEPVFNPDYGIEGIPHMTIVAPDGTVRDNELDPRQPLAEKAAKIDALLNEFKLKTPPPVAAATR